MALQDQLVVGLTLGATYALIAIGFSLVFRSVGLLNFTHPEFMMMGAMVGLTVTSRYNLSPIFAILASGLASGLLALLVERTAIAPIMKRQGQRINQIIASLGWATVLTNAAMLIWGPQPMAYRHTFGGTVWKIGSVPVAAQHVFILSSSLVLMVALQLFFKYTRLGLAMRATADDSTMALLTGIETRHIVSATFFLSGSLAGMAGVLIGSLFYASFDLGQYGLRALSAAVIGGFGDPVGAVLGGFVLGVVETLSGTYVSSAYRDAMAFAIAILVLLVRPYGLVGRRRRTV
ncbi:MAG TPA: branched-chain amino acid ABC transporter permease [Symbiobacteriaceae bacterium]|nr:branched-chain amino acid ABC transporter permease [Symbiobacteriaceae bacterium]